MTPPRRPSRRPRRPGSRLTGWLAVLLLLVPLAEVAVIVSVGRVIGAWPTVALLLAESALGAWLVRREGARAWGALRQALATGRMPAGELADGALVLVGGTLLLTPGFLSDVVGFACILPFTRPLARGLLARAIAHRLVTAAGPFTGPLLTTTLTTSGAYRASTPPGSAPRAARPGDDDEIIEGEIL